MKTGRRPRLPNTQTPEERVLWKSIRFQLSERRRQKRQKRPAKPVSGHIVLVYVIKTAAHLFREFRA